VYLELFQAKNTGPAPVGGAGPDYPAWRHLAFKVDDVDATLSRMGADARVTLGPLSFEDFIPGWRTVWVADPDGNVIEISQGFVDQPNPPSLEPGEAAVDTDARAQWADRVWRGDDTGGPGATPAPSGGAGASTANVLDQAQWADHVWRGDEQRPTGRPASGAAGRS
jgi:hypothetical protein